VITLISCIDRNRGIGNKGELLTKPPLDFKLFKELTTNNFVLFGRNTYEEIGHPLPNRQNIVITSDTMAEYHPEVSVYPSAQDVYFDYINYTEKDVDLFICGGEMVYKDFLPHADFIQLTIVDHEFEEADRHFPEFDLNEWKPVNLIKNEADENYPYDYYFALYERK
jgi:dihydrofolate reductase